MPHSDSSPISHSSVRLLRLCGSSVSSASPENVEITCMGYASSSCCRSGSIPWLCPLWHLQGKEKQAVKVRAPLSPCAPMGSTEIKWKLRLGSMDQSRFLGLSKIWQFMIENISWWCVAKPGILDPASQSFPLGVQQRIKGVLQPWTSLVHLVEVQFGSNCIPLKWIHAHPVPNTQICCCFTQKPCHLLGYFDWRASVWLGSSRFGKDSRRGIGLCY